MIRLLALASLLAFALALAACGGGSATIPTVSVEAADFSFALPDSVAGGRTRVLLANKGKESHHVQFLRLNEGVTMAQFEAALRQNPEGALALVALEGGAGSVGPGDQSEAVVDLQPGQYAVVCFIPSPDGVPHLAKGMIKPLTVGGAAAKQPREPKSVATVSMTDFGFSQLENLRADKATLKVVNKGQEPHEMGVLRLKGVPAAQVKQMLSAPPPPAGAAPPPGPPPFEEAGGLQAVMPGATGWTTLNLKAGEYALVCFVPSPKNRGAPHIALGMFVSFSVK